MAECNQIGRMIKYERKRAGISMKILCRGLCSHSLLVRVEKGERDCEKILADALLQRAGVSADKFFYMMNPEEQDWLLLNEKLISYVEAGDIKKAKPLMEAYRSMTAKGNKLHKQQLLLYQVVLDWKNKENEESMLQKLSYAWNISMDNISPDEVMKGRLTLTELIINMMHNRILEDKGCKNEAAEGYEYLLTYLEHYTDEEDRVKLYPQIAYRLSLLYIYTGEVAKAVKLAQKAVTLLQVRGRLFYLRQFLDIMLRYATLDQDKRIMYQELSKSLKWMYRSYQIDEKIWTWNIPFSMTDVELCGDFIKRRREALGLSQEKVAEGICDPVSMSRIECGRVAPQKQTLQKLLERVGMSGNEFIAVVHVEYAELLELAVEISICLSHTNGGAAEPLIEKLESLMQNPDRYDRQFLQYAKALAWYGQNKIDAATHHVLQEEALYQTFPKIESEKLNKWCFSSQESSILNALSHSCEKVGKVEEVCALLSILLKQYENKPFPLRHYAAGYELTARNLGNLLGNQGKFREAIEAADKAIQLGLQTGRGVVLKVALYDRGWDMEQLWCENTYQKEESLPYIKAAYYLNQLVAENRYDKFFVEHIKKLYGA
ncbi:MAG TPA: helix-turn-helix domain-containing protein [Lachnospiraceae bacterium]|nr:helix-turn-helix domain-containing protein [Lachnospiraceae bacterium]